MTQSVRAILICLVAYLCFDLMSIHVRYLSARYSAQELSVYRNIFGVDNLFDEDYAEHLSRSGADVTGFDPIAQLPEPGRTLWLKLDARL